MKKAFPKKKLLSLALRLAVLGVIFTLVALNYDSLVNIDVRALVEHSASRELAALICIGIFALKGITFVIPAMLIYVSVGMAFSTSSALLISLAGIALEVTVTYLLGVALGGDYVTKLIKKAKNGEKLLNMKDGKKFTSVFVIRVLPVFPIDFASLFFGSLKLGFVKYLLISVAGIAPRVILFTLLGNKIYDYLPMELLLKAALCLIPLAAVVLVIRLIFKQKKQSKGIAQSENYN